MRTPVKIIINPSEITAGTRGASLGPGAIMTAARRKGSTFFSRFPIETIPDENQALDTSTPFPFAKRADGLLRIYERISERIKHTLQQGEFPLVLAGDHGSAGGTIAGIKMAHPDKRLGVIWIDAHGDLHSPYTTPSGNMHGMPLSTALNEDNTPCQRNAVGDETEGIWRQLKSLGGIVPKINPEDLVFIGVRDVEPEEISLMERLHITNHTVESVRKLGTTAIVDAIQQQLSACDLIYLSFDVDSMDPDLTSHGTGTPVPGGLTPAEAAHFLTAFLADPRTTCLEIVEVNPCLDEKTNTMAEITFGLIETCFNTTSSDGTTN